MAQKDYNHQKIEKKWQKEWEKAGIYKVADTVEGKENYYILVEFSYPSGNLHVGHWYAFSVPDIFARYKRMQGFNVLYPMGFDAFGLPAENAAIKNGGDPKDWTDKQMERMRTQLKSMGAMFDWSREVVTCSPEYYKWTQWMFNQFLKHDLVYRAVTKVNWCPKDQTVLANEQVLDNKCERCGSEVIQRDQEQWMLRITKYADRLIDDLDALNWPNAIKESQKNWIGRSEGSEIEFSIKGNIDLGKVKIFTTRADTLFGVTYIVLAPEHPFIEQSLLTFESGCTNKSEIEAYISETKKKSELDRQQSKEKTGIEVKGIKAINPANGEEVSVWIADYVLAGYGTGAVMAVPAHDERDFEFAKKYRLPVREVIEPEFITESGPDAINKNFPFEGKRETVVAIVKHWSEDKFLCLDWKKYGWRTFVVGGTDGEDKIHAAKREILEETGYKNATYIKSLGGAIHNKFFARHKEINRWAELNALYFELENGEQEEVSEKEKETHNAVWVKKEEVLSYIKDDLSDKIFWSRLLGQISPYTGLGIMTNSSDFNGLTSLESRKKITEFVGGKLVSTYRLRDWGISRQRYWGCPIPIVYDPEGNAHPVPDEHLPWLLPTDVDHTPDGTPPLARSKELFERTERIFGEGWRPEVETMDTFVDSSWYFYRYLDNQNENEFATKGKMKMWMPIDLYMGGAEHTTMHLLYSRFWVKAMHDLGLVNDTEAYTVRRNRGLILGPDGNKMSKSKGNVINPDEIVDRLGADTVRMYLAFMGPYGVTTNYPWDPNGVVGVRRFLERVWKLKEKVADEGSSVLLQKTIKKVAEDIEEHKYNTAIASMMILINEWEKEGNVQKEDFKKFLQLLAPFAPHMTEELWQELGEKKSIHLSGWPKYDPKLLVENTVTVVVQVNGKLRGTLSLPKDTIEAQAVLLAKEDKDVARHLEGVEIIKVVFIPNKLLNFVVKN